jgi:alginate O-acetyltransferase complex protein AlgI
LATIWLTLAIVSNLGLLGYFKYANFFVINLQGLLDANWHFAEVMLPIGISFYSFTQIAYLVDTWGGKVREARAVHYGLFVSYFPHLIAGPVLHHAQMMPQFENAETYRFNAANFTAGAAVLALGLFKKIILADGIAPYADAVFAGADAGQMPTAQEAALGALAYTSQLYFDFSGYSDMALGLSRMFNVTLPFNFNSPYKALNISDFWRRWHISLSTFLRDYLYVPLGGNRKGPTMRYVNLCVTMILGGLWHGASWSFVLWGTLHGGYLVVHHAFRAVVERAGWAGPLDRSRLFAMASWLLTFAAVVCAWILFRAHTLDGAGRVLVALIGQGDAGLDGHALFWNAGLSTRTGWLWCTALTTVAVALPNSNRFGLRTLDAVQASPTARVACLSVSWLLIGFLVLVNTTRDSVSAFIYFNF